jgi:hypothetical protein
MSTLGYDEAFSLGRVARLASSSIPVTPADQTSHNGGVVADAGTNMHDMFAGLD